MKTRTRRALARLREAGVGETPGDAATADAPDDADHEAPDEPPTRTGPCVRGGARGWRGPPAAAAVLPTPPTVGRTFELVGGSDPIEAALSGRGEG